MGKNSKISFVDEGQEHGLYVWYTDDGRRVEDSEGNVMNIPATRGDMHAINKLQEAAKHYGVPGGKAVFMPGRRRVSQSEWEDQNARMHAGLLPDPYDYKAIEEELNIHGTRND